MEGFWSIQFNGVQGWGAGVVTLLRGQVFGGDSAFLYTGTYNAEQKNLTANVHVARFAQGAANVMGQDQFDLTITGTQKDNVIAVVGTIPGTPLRLNGLMQKRGELPQ